MPFVCIPSLDEFSAGQDFFSSGSLTVSRFDRFTLLGTPTTGNYDEVWVVNTISIGRTYMKLDATWVENTDPTLTPSPTPAAAQPVYVDSLEERAAKSWKVSSDNPDNYLTKF